MTADTDREPWEEGKAVCAICGDVTAAYDICDDCGEANCYKHMIMLETLDFLCDRCREKKDESNS